MAKYKILIVEDDVLISEYLKSILLGLNYEVTDICPNLDFALKSIENDPPDVALLDIRMHGKNEGIEVAQHLKERKIPFIFITSFSDKSTIQEATKQHPKGYIVKPFTAHEVEEVLSILIKENLSEYIIIRQPKTVEKIKLSEIKWIQSDNVYLEVHLSNRKIILRDTLNNFCAEHPHEALIRVHRSYVVNKACIEKIHDNKICIGQTVIPVSKTYRHFLTELL